MQKWARSHTPNSEMISPALYAVPRAAKILNGSSWCCCWASRLGVNHKSMDVQRMAESADRNEKQGRMKHRKDR